MKNKNDFNTIDEYIIYLEGVRDGMLEANSTINPISITPKVKPVKMVKVKKNNKYMNNYKHWTSDDTAKLWLLHTKGTKVSEIARQLNRKKSSIKSRLYLISIGKVKVRG